MTLMAIAFQMIGNGFIMTSLMFDLVPRMMMTGGLLLLKIMVGGIMR